MKLRVYVGLSQAPGVYELAFLTHDLGLLYHGTLGEFEALAQEIVAKVTEQRQRDAEDIGSM